MGAEGGVSSQSEAQSFRKMRDRLSAVAQPRAPLMDANTTALRALVTTDWMAQPEACDRLAAAARDGAFDPQCIADLCEVARSILHVLSNLQAPCGQLPKDVRDEAQTMRHSLAERMSKSLDQNEDAAQWLAVVHAGQDDLDLLFDLRILGMLFREHGSAFKGDPALSTAAARALQIEGLVGSALQSGASSEWLDWLARGWTLLANLFERVSRVGRELLHDVPGMSFPSLAGLAKSQRQQKARDSAGPSQRSLRPGTGSGAPAGMPPIPGAAVPTFAIAPPAPTEDPTGDRITPIGETFTAASEADLATLEPIRRAPRFNVELQVDIFSDSNLYVGFTENLSTAGIFVATHVLRPMGAVVQMSVQFPGRSEPLHLRGEVRWVREYSPLSDACPGMGIQFQTLTPEDELLVRTFLSTREPIFFDD